MANVRMSQSGLRGYFRRANLLTSLVLKSPDNALLRLADPIDRLIARTPLKYWMRSVRLGRSRG